MTRSVVAAVDLVVGGTFDGTPALSRTVDRYLLDVDDWDVPVLVRSRFINQAAAIVSSVCDQYFQGLRRTRSEPGL